MPDLRGPLALPSPTAAPATQLAVRAYCSGKETWGTSGAGAVVMKGQSAPEAGGRRSREKKKGEAPGARGRRPAASRAQSRRRPRPGGLLGIPSGTPGGCAQENKRLQGRREWGGRREAHHAGGVAVGDGVHHDRDVRGALARLRSRAIVGSACVRRGEAFCC